MIFRIPLYVRADPATKGAYIASSLFFPDILRTDKNLNRLISKLAREIGKTVEALGKQARHDECARWAFHPVMTEHRLDFDIELRRRRVKVRYLIIAFQHMGKRIAFSPSIPGVWFEVERKADLQARAEVVYSDYWRTRERDDEDVRPEETKITGQAWIQTLELSVNVPAMIPEAKEIKFLNLGNETLPDGANELTRVGRCLDWLFPEELDEALLRDREVDELSRLLEAPDRRPILICGPRQSGKTTIIHEVVRRRVSKRKSPFVAKENVWLIAPQRLISGMSYVGQWEARLLAILKNAKRREHVLYFDDLVGLFLAGISANSTLNVAQVLKPYLERREIRILGEITPEALRVLQERDRGFADLFHILPVRETNDLDTLKILIGVQRRLEGKFRTAFDLDVLPSVVDLMRRYERANAFPGKAARMLTRLAVKADAEKPLERAEGTGPLEPKSKITRDTTFLEFQASSGLSLKFLDERARLEKDTIVDALSAMIIGQDESVRAAADVIAVAKARLNDPDRPLAAFLFLGPTGVGKTECAKAIARYLFGDAERLLRFDMNEFVTPGSSTRLVGNFSQPEGLLTSAIRRQPFAVVLLDEIEKADPEVFDLLLQVLGEGRLTDSLGRTADFTNAIVVLTSNLGVREAEASVGFRESAETAAASYTRAAERFFRPEFFNRLDRVIPFRRLSRAHMKIIADRLVFDVLKREGFAQRKCLMNVSAAAIDRVIESGYDPVLGARAMKRAVERELVQPASVRLAALPVNRFTIVDVDVAPEGKNLSVQVKALEYATALDSQPESVEPFRVQIEQLDDRLGRMEDRLDTIRPGTPVASGHVTTEHERYFAAKQMAKDLSDQFETIYDAIDNKRLNRLEALLPESAGRNRDRVRKVSHLTNVADWDPSQPNGSLFAAIKMEEGLSELTAKPKEPSEEVIVELRRKLGLLNAIFSSNDPRGEATLAIEPPPDTNWAHWLILHAYTKIWATALGLEVDWREAAAKSPIRIITLRGIHAGIVADLEVGTHLVIPKHGNMMPVRVRRLASFDDVPGVTRDYGPILRLYAEGGQSVDLRTGLSCATTHLIMSLADFTLSTLPLPE